jgi:hypothetical protein
MKLSTKGDQNWTDLGHRLAFATPALVIEPATVLLAVYCVAEGPNPPAAVSVPNGRSCAEGGAGRNGAAATGMPQKSAAYHATGKPLSHRL